MAHSCCHPSECKFYFIGQNRWVPRDALDSWLAHVFHSCSGTLGGIMRIYAKAFPVYAVVVEVFRANVVAVFRVAPLSTKVSP
jgi:hypothetical protein